MQGRTIFHLRRVEEDTFIPPLRKIDAPTLSKSERGVPLDYQRQPEDPLSTQAPSWARSCRPAQIPWPRGHQWQWCQQMEPKIIPGLAFCSSLTEIPALASPLWQTPLLSLQASFDPTLPLKSSFKYSFYFPGNMFKKDAAPIQHV